MIKYITTIFCLFLFALSAWAKPEVGKPAPVFKTPEFNLEDAKGKVVVLYFYPKDNTSNCTIEAEQFAAYFEDFKSVGAQIVGVSTDSSKSHENFSKKHNLPFTLISNGGSVTKLYDVAGIIWTQRATFLIDREGKIAYIWSSVNVEKHAQEVLDKIKELSL